MKAFEAAPYCEICNETMDALPGYPGMWYCEDCDAVDPSDIDSIRDFVEGKQKPNVFIRRIRPADPVLDDLLAKIRGRLENVSNRGWEILEALARLAPELMSRRAVWWTGDTEGLRAFINNAPADIALLLDLVEDQQVLIQALEAARCAEVDRLRTDIVDAEIDLRNVRETLEAERVQNRNRIRVMSQRRAELKGEHDTLTAKLEAVRGYAQLLIDGLNSGWRAALEQQALEEALAALDAPAGEGPGA